MQELGPPSEELRKRLLEEELKLRKKQPEHWAKSKYRKYANMLSRKKEKAEEKAKLAAAELAKATLGDFPEKHEILKQKIIVEKVAEKIVEIKPVKKKAAKKTAAKKAVKKQAKKKTIKKKVKRTVKKPAKKKAKK